MVAHAAPGELTAFLVEVRYREPSYESRHGVRPEPYRFRYRRWAASADAAIADALAEFWHITALSSSGWTREIVGVSASVASL